MLLQELLKLSESSKGVIVTIQDPYDDTFQGYLGPFASSKEASAAVKSLEKKGAHLDQFGKIQTVGGSTGDYVVAFHSAYRKGVDWVDGLFSTAAEAKKHAAAAKKSESNFERAEVVQILSVQEFIDGYGDDWEPDEDDEDQNTTSFRVTYKSPKSGEMQNSNFPAKGLEDAKKIFIAAHPSVDIKTATFTELK